LESLELDTSNYQGANRTDKVEKRTCVTKEEEASVTVLTELGTTERFSNVDSLASYVGLVPNVYGSGEREYIGNMTKRKNSYVQSILIQCAWMSLRRDPSMTKRYHELSHRMKPNKAIIRIARKLLTRIRYVLINKEEYMLSV
jgi:transposase